MCNGFKGHIPERDGILAGLYFLDLMLKTGKKPSELLTKIFDLVGPHYYNRNDERGDIAFFNKDEETYSELFKSKGYLRSL